MFAHDIIYYLGVGEYLHTFITSTVGTVNVVSFTLRPLYPWYCIVVGSGG